VGGSVRTPAAWANCVGFRPSSGRIPDYPGSIADGSISTAGIFTRSVRDVPLFMQAVDGPNLHSAIPYPFTESSFSTSLDALNNIPSGKVAWVTNFAGIDSPDDINQCMKEARKVIESLGVVVEEVRWHAVWHDGDGEGG